MKRQWFRDYLSDSKIKRLIAWGDHLAKYGDYNWKKNDAELYLLLIMLLKDYYRERGYEYRRQKKDHELPRTK